MILKAICIFRYVNTLSFDVVAGALAVTIFFAKIFAVKIIFQEMACLGLTIWLIYTADRLLDVYGMDRTASTHRHQFYQKYFWIMVVVGIVVLTIIFFLLFYIRTAVLFSGSGLLGLVFLYLLFRRKLTYVKELSAALLYTVGVLLLPVTLSTAPVSLFVFAFVLLFFITVLTHLLLFSWVGKHQDRQDRQNSFVEALGDVVARRILFLLLLSQFALAVYCLVFLSDLTFGILIFMIINMILIGFSLKTGWAVKYDRYRVVGDSLFLLFYLY